MTFLLSYLNFYVIFKPFVNGYLAWKRNVGFWKFVLFFKLWVFHFAYVDLINNSDPSWTLLFLWRTRLVMEIYLYSVLAFDSFSKFWTQKVPSLLTQLGFTYGFLIPKAHSFCFKQLPTWRYLTDDISIFWMLGGMHLPLNSKTDHLSNCFFVYLQLCIAVIMHSMT